MVFSDKILQWSRYYSWQRLNSLLVRWYIWHTRSSWRRFSVWCEIRKHNPPPSSGNLHHGSLNDATKPGANLCCIGALCHRVQYGGRDIAVNFYCRMHGGRWRGIEKSLINWINHCVWCWLCFGCSTFIWWVWCDLTYTLYITSRPVWCPRPTSNRWSSGTLALVARLHCYGSSIVS